MSVDLKHVGFGRWIVLENGAKIAGPMPKIDAEDFARRRPPPSIAPPTSSRDYWRRVNADLNKPLTADEADLKAVLSKRHGDDAVRRMLPAIMKIVRSDGRRVRKRLVLPAPQAAA